MEAVVCVDAGIYHGLLHRNNLLSVDLSDTAGMTLQGVLQSTARLHTHTHTHFNDTVENVTNK